MQLAHKVRTPYWTQLPEQHDTLYPKASHGEAGGLEESAAEGTMPDAATFQKDKKESNARSLFFVSVARQCMLSRLVVHASLPLPNAVVAMRGWLP